jgi:hypothetical protein
MQLSNFETVTNIKMSAKLIVHKFETGLNFKSLQITIEDDLSDTKFSEWLEGRSFQKKKEKEKSSRLVVKIVSGSENSKFNLDSCAKLIKNFDLQIYQNTTIDDFKQANVRSERHYCRSQPSKVNDEEIYDSYFQNGNEQPGEQHLANYNGVMSLHNNAISQNMVLTTLSPLEYSLEKVKENNARIMENIHMLNRTLNYTKKKEMLDVVTPKSMRSFPCATCGKCFVYETGLKRHYSMRHSIIDSQPTWQVVWTCVECFQVWPECDLALKHSKECCQSETTDFVKEIKTSSLLQCEFCEKVFTSIPRLLKHTKTHTTANNYECTSCNLFFSSYKAADEHWLVCQWLRTYYCFSLPKLLLCNACDRKFRNYEQLYTHR